MLSEAGHIVKSHELGPVVVVGCFQYVLFSLLEDPHVAITNVQHTPNPSAHEPELVPALSEHSALV